MAGAGPCTWWESNGHILMSSRVCVLVREPDSKPVRKLVLWQEEQSSRISWGRGGKVYLRRWALSRGWWRGGGIHSNICRRNIPNENTNSQCLGRASARVFQNQQGGQCVCKAVRGNVGRNWALDTAWGQILPLKNTVLGKTGKLRQIKTGNIVH